MNLLLAKLYRYWFGVRPVQVFVAGECRFDDEDVVWVRCTNAGVKLWVLYEVKLEIYVFPDADEVRISPYEGGWRS